MTQIITWNKQHDNDKITVTVISSIASSLGTNIRYYPLPFEMTMEELDRMFPINSKE